ncbi:hypothetical protein JOM56_004549 [Amanita muscaria]
MRMKYPLCPRSSLGHIPSRHSIRHHSQQDLWTKRRILLFRASASRMLLNQGRMPTLRSPPMLPVHRHQLLKEACFIAPVISTFKAVRLLTTLSPKAGTNISVRQSSEYRWRLFGLTQLFDFLVIIAFICLGILLLLLDPHLSSRFATTDPSTNIFPYFPSRARILYTNGEDTIHALERLEPFVSHGAINGSFLQDPDRQVHPGTRERILSKMKAWIDNPNPTQHIFWLHGPAGAGKSTIAQTILRSYTTEKVPANFFFLHSDSDRSNGNRLFTTIAWQSIPAIKGHIARSLNEQPDLPRKDVETQFQELIVRPFEALGNDTHLPQLSDMVVVIDGVDECVNERLQERILKVIGNVATNIPLRFLIISRPEAHINNTIWPDQKTIKKLAYKASGQFIYASTVIRFLRDEDNSAKHQ